MRKNNVPLPFLFIILCPSSRDLFFKNYTLWTFAMHQFTKPAENWSQKKTNGQVCDRLVREIRWWKVWTHVPEPIKCPEGAAGRVGRNRKSGPFFSSSLCTVKLHSLSLACVLRLGRRSLSGCVGGWPLLFHTSRGDCFTDIGWLPLKL